MRTENTFNPFRCRSIASLDVENAAKKSDSNEDIIEDEKGKPKKCNINNNTASTNNRTNSSDDNIKLNDYKSQTRSRKQAINTWSAEDEPTGRGDSTNHNRKVQNNFYLFGDQKILLSFFAI